MTDERWDGDTTGVGVSDGLAFAPALRALLDEMARPDWNTEEPRAHLLPHLERWLAREDSPWTLGSVEVEDNILVLRLEHGSASQGELRQDVYALLATVAEPTTAIVEREEGEEHVVDVTLGLVPGQSAFPKGHGHLLRLRIRTDP